MISSYIPLSFCAHRCHLSLGVDCVIVKSGRRICGTGASLGNAPLVQDKSYFEMKIQCGGSAVDGCAVTGHCLRQPPLYYGHSS